MAQQLSLFDLPPRTRNPAPAPATEASGAAPVAQPPPPAGEQPVSDLYGTVYRCYAPLVPGEPVEATLTAALAAFRTRVGAEPAHIAIHPDDAAVLAAATTLPVRPQRACPRGQVRLALP